METLFPSQIDIAFGFDQGFAPHTSVAISSIVRSAPGAAFRFLMITDFISELDRSRVESVAPRASFHWINLSPKDLPEFTARNHFTRAILFRLALEKHAPQDCRRVIYLDSDIIVRQDIRSLWNEDLGTNPIGAVTDADTDAAAFARQWGLQGQPAYFNSGVLLIDLNRVREGAFFSKAARTLAENSAGTPYPDQDALNIALWGQWCELPKKWNVQRNSVVVSRKRGERAKILRGSAIVHYTGSHKPWLPNSYHPWSGLYWRHLLRSPFRSEVYYASGMTAVELLRIMMRWMHYHYTFSVKELNV